MCLHGTGGYWVSGLIPTLALGISYFVVQLSRAACINSGLLSVVSLVDFHQIGFGIAIVAQYEVNVLRRTLSVCWWNQQAAFGRSRTRPGVELCRCFSHGSSITTGQRQVEFFLAQGAGSTQCSGAKSATDTVSRVTSKSLPLWSIF